MYILTHTCDGNICEPSAYKTKNEALCGLTHKIAEIAKTNLQNEWINEPLPKTDEEIVEYLKTTGHIIPKSETEIDCFDIEHLEIFETANLDRTKELLINAFEWAIEVSEQVTHDILRATGITSEELEEIRYDKSNFPKMHEWIEEE